MTGNCGEQFVALTKKNILLKWRDKFKSAFEILIPVFVMLIMLAIRSAVSIKDREASLNLWKYDELSGANMDTLATRIDTRGHSIGIAPDVAWTQALGTQLETEYPELTGQILYFTDDDSLVDYLQADDYSTSTKPHMEFGLVFDNYGTNNKYDFTIRMNSSSARDGFLRQVPFLFEEDGIDELAVTFDDTDFDTFFYNGFMTVQSWVEDYIITLSDPTYNATTLGFQAFPTPTHKFDDFIDYVEGILGLFFTLGFLWPVTRLINNLVTEKELKIAETMKMMGMSDLAYFFSWFGTYVCMYIITCLLIVLVTMGSVYKYTGGGTIFFMFFLFCIATYAFCVMIAAFFDSANKASTWGGVIFLLSYFAAFSFNEDTSAGTKSAACLAAPICFGLASVNIATFEGSEQAADGDNYDVVIDNFSLETYFVMIIVDIIIYFLLASYLSRVVPTSYGVKKPWYFCLLPPFCCCCCFQSKNAHQCPCKNEVDKAGSDRTNQTDPVDRSAYFEPIETEAIPGISISNLEKVFPGRGGAPPVRAVHDFNLDMYESQILALLGHNGAGKTTVMNMLSGMLPVTSGSAIISGHSVTENMDAIRESMGICPQHNVLYDKLTVKEHLVLFARLKSVPSDQLDQAVDQMIRDVGLTEKVDAYSHSLSGGMKRKLSVGIALIGNSKVVFLDEPTSGMDPYSRRSTWDLLNRYKQGRVIILTTHFMDEADQLGDRIAIMSQGEVQCCGSSLFLKRKFGVGYTFTVSKKSTFRDFDLKQVIAQAVPSYSVLSSVGNEISFRLPLDSVSNFPDMFDELDKRLDDLGIHSYGISVTTLEEVFLRVGHAGTSSAEGEVKRDTELNEKTREIQEGPTIHLDDTPVDANASGQKNDTKEGTNTADLQKHEVTKDEKHDEKLVPDLTFEEQREALAFEEEEFTPEEKLFSRHLIALFWKRWHNAKRDIKVLMWQIIYPTIIVLLGIGLLKLSSGLRDRDNTVVGTGLLNTPNYVPVNPSSAHFVNWATSGEAVQQMTSATDISNMSQYLLDTYSAQAESRYGAYIDNPDHTSPVIFWNSTGSYSAPIFLNLYHTMIGRNRTSNSDFSITLHSHPYPLTSNQKALNDSLVAFMISIAFAFIPASYVAYIVKERELQIKHLQIMTGVNIMAYWLSNFIWDFLCFLAPACLSLIALLIFDIEALIGENSGGTIVCMLLYGFDVIWFTYLVSNLFKSSNSAQNLVLLFYILTGAILLIAHIVMISISSTQDVARDLTYLWRFLPNFAFGEAIVGLMIRSSVSVYGEKKDVWDMDVTGKACLYMALCGLGYMALVFAVEKIKVSQQALECLSLNTDVPQQDFEFQEDEDVQAEKEEVHRLVVANVHDDKETLRCYHMRKVYPPRALCCPDEKTDKPKVAVRDISFRVYRGECFGLLGINGAGKTTALQMITGNFLPTKGTIFVQGSDSRENQDHLRHMMGYCPQFDSLLPTLTARESLTLFARIKGYPEATIVPYVDKLIERLSLTQYADRVCGSYSGGNKRKLCVGIALVGNPSIVILDEPTTGMDPVSKRFVWNLILDAMHDNRSLILTSHSLEEVEALCSRLTIMVGGRFRCLGSGQHLRSTFGKDYQVEVNAPRDQRSGIIEFFSEIFEGSRVLEVQPEHIKFRLLKNMSLGRIFGLIEENKEALAIREYSVSETTLEQIFLHFAKQQQEEEGPAPGLQYDDSLDVKLPILRDSQHSKQDLDLFTQPIAPSVSNNERKKGTSTIHPHPVAEAIEMKHIPTVAFASNDDNNDQIKSQQEFVNVAQTKQEDQQEDQQQEHPK